MTVNSLKAAALLEFGNGRVERFRLRLMMVMLPLLWRTKLLPSHQCAKRRKNKAVAVIAFTASTTSMDWAGFEQTSFHAELMELENREYVDWLRSWVQIPPGPLLPVVQIRY